MNVFITGLCDEIKNHVILNQPKSLAEAENLAHLREAVSRNSGVSSSLATAHLIQEQRIKELESNMGLLVSLAAQQKSSMLPPVSSFGDQTAKSTSISSQHLPVPLLLQQTSASISAVDAPVNIGTINALKGEIIAAINNSFQHNQPRRGQGHFWSPMRNRGGARGRNLRTTDGQPICNFCRKVGHVARYCS